MRIYIDTEFIENGPDYPLRLISLGAVSEDGDTFYGEVSDCPLEQANDWVKANVFPHLLKETARYMPLRELGGAFSEWVRTRTGKPEFWGWYADYDWVVFCQMFGRMIDLPDGWPMYCRDLKQVCDEHGIRLSDDGRDDEHNALSDAMWICQAHAELTEQLSKLTGREG